MNDGASLMFRITEAVNEIIAREQEELSDITDHSCFGAGWSHGAISAAKEIMDCLGDDQPPTVAE